MSDRLTVDRATIEDARVIYPPQHQETGISGGQATVDAVYKAIQDAKAQYPGIDIPLIVLDKGDNSWGAWWQNDDYGYDNIPADLRGLAQQEGGIIVINRGVVQRAVNEGDLSLISWVVAHELGHEYHNHVNYYTPEQIAQAEAEANAFANSLGPEYAKWAQRYPEQFKDFDKTPTKLSGIDPTIMDIAIPAEVLNNLGHHDISAEHVLGEHETSAIVPNHQQQEEAQGFSR